jgi:hypothetical protein
VVQFAVVDEHRSPSLLIYIHTVEARCRTRLLEQAAWECLANQEREVAASDRSTATGRLGVERGRGRRGRGRRERGRRTTSFFFRVLRQSMDASSIFFVFCFLMCVFLRGPWLLSGVRLSTEVLAMWQSACGRLLAGPRARAPLPPPHTQRTKYRQAPPPPAHMNWPRCLRRSR